MSTSYDIVWPFSVPPVCTGLWMENDWMTYCLGCRPRDYTGGAFDKTAWADYKEQKRIAQYNRLLHKGAE